VRFDSWHQLELHSVSRSQFVNGRQIDSYLDPALGWQREKAITPIFPSYSRQEWLSAEHSLDSVIE